MDFDDSFTERVFQRNRARKELLNQKKGEILSVGIKRGVLTDGHQVNSDEPPSKSPKRSSAFAVQGSSDKENLAVQEDDTNVFVPIHTAANSRGLSALRKNVSNDEDDKSSFKSSHEHLSSETKTYVFSTNTKELCTGRSSRMANLAANIRQWEDDATKPTFSTKSAAPPANATTPASQNTFSMKLVYTEKRSNSKEFSNNDLALASMHAENETSASIHRKVDCVDPKGTPKKLLDWNAAVAATLETSSPVVPSLKTEDVKTGGFQKKYPAPNTERSCSDESMDENDFAENYNIMSNLRGDFKKELDYSPFKHIGEDQKKIEPPKIEARADLRKIEVREYQKKIEPPKVEAKEYQKKMEPPQIEAFAKRTAEVDPAELPLAARRALFEKNLLSGTPKVNEDVCFSLSIAQRAAMFESAAKMNCVQKSKVPVVPKYDKSTETGTVQTVIKANPGIINAVSPVKKAVSPVKKIPFPHTSAPSPTKRVGNHVFLIQQKLAENSTNNLKDKEFATEGNEVSSMDFHAEESESEESKDCPSEESMEENQSENDHFEKLPSTAVGNNSEMNHLEKFPSSVGNNYSEINHLGKLSSSSVENNYSESGLLGKLSSPSVENSCSGRDHSGKSSSVSAENNYSGIGHLEKLPSSCVENNSDLCYPEKLSSSGVQNNSEMDYLKKLSSSSGESNCFEISHPKKSSSSSMENNGSVIDSSKKLSSSSVENSSFEESSYGRQSCTSDSSAGSYSVTSAEGEGGSENKKENNSGTPLLYTVSFYRKQKQETRLTPVQTIRREKERSTPELPDSKYTEIIQERIKCLQDEILRQQTVISQTSQALNLCSATLEFSGSTEQVEGERLLLVATQKRQACLNEINRLKQFGAQGESIADDRGTMTISHIILPLKREFIASQLEGKDNDTVHYFLCLIRHGAQVIVTQMMSTDDRIADGTLVFTNHIQLQDLPPTFSVIFEVYALQTKKEVLPHEKKYHIKRESSKIRLTPKGKKNNEKMMFPTVSSPGGPNAVRSPCFGVVGFTRFTLQNCNKNTFTLDKVPFTSPLEGVLRVKLQLHAEHKVMEKGFLTLFDDVGGYGAWLRRWCVLDANNIALWKYPDDEHKKEPAAVINLKQCITGLVKPVNRNVCARPHTFQLVTVRPHEKGDQPTLISRSVNTLTTTKHLLSADTKEERIIWCDKLNEALNNVRKWDPQALRPVEGMQV